MKRFTALLCIFCLLLALSSSVLADGYNEYMEIKIGLLFGTEDVGEVRLTSNGGFNICSGENDNYGYLFSMLENELSVTKCGESDYYINGNYYIARGGELTIKPAYGIIGVNGNDYRGFITLKRIEGSDITVINVVGLEEYLFSVVGKEMSPSWNLEALKAQAVCARTYAKTNLDRFKKYGFDLCNTQNSQVYAGMKSESESTILACAQTAGQSVRYEGVPVPVYYFSSGGGSTESPEYVWGGKLPYLKSVTDPYEKESEATKYNWTSSITIGELEKKMSDKEYLIGDIISVEATKRSESGRVTELVVTGTLGSKSAALNSVRGLIGSDLLPSQQFVISYEVPQNENGVVLPLPDETVVTFTGHGWGHAVGMSQWGAKAMADEGKNYLEILNFYFSGVEIY